MTEQPFTIAKIGHDHRGEKWAVILAGRTTPSIIADSPAKADDWGVLLSSPEDSKEAANARLRLIPAWYFNGERSAVRASVEALIATGDLTRANDLMDHVEDRIADWATD